MAWACSAASRPGPVEEAAILEGEQALGVEPFGRPDQCRGGILAHLDALLGGLEIEVQQGVQFVDQIGVEGHAGPLVVKIAAMLPLRGSSGLRRSFGSAITLHPHVGNAGFHELTTRLLEAEAAIEAGGLDLGVQHQFAAPRRRAAASSRRSSSARPTPRPRQAGSTAMRPMCPSASRRPVPMASPAASKATTWRLAASNSSHSMSSGTPCSRTKISSRSGRATEASFVPVACLDAELDDVDGRVGRYPIEKLDDVGVLHAHAADRAGGAHCHRVRAAVQVNVAAHGIDLAEAVLPRFAARQPEDAGEYPVAAGVGGGQFGAPHLAGRAAAHEHRIRRGASADFCPDQVAAARRHVAAALLAGAVLRGRYGVAAQQVAVVVMQLQRLGREC